MSYTFDDALRDRLHTNLAAFQRREQDVAGLRPAAVAVTIVGAADHGGEASFLLTRRSATLRAHSSQWALPGGRLDPGESPEDAVRRELAEEVGLHVGPEDVIGLLDDYPTRSGFLITPFVIWGRSASDLVAGDGEVVSIHHIPLAELDRPDNPRLLTIPESDRPVIQLALAGSLIHAPTAAVLHQFSEVGLHGRPTRVVHFEQPVFAWR